MKTKISHMMCPALAIFSIHYSKFIDTETFLKQFFFIYLKCVKLNKILYQNGLNKFQSLIHSYFLSQLHEFCSDLLSK